MKCLVIGVESVEKKWKQIETLSDKIRLQNSHQLFHPQNNLEGLQLKDELLKQVAQSHLTVSENHFVFNQLECPRQIQ